MRIEGLKDFQRRLDEIILQNPKRARFAVYAASEAARRWMITKYLSGQRVRRRTGTLARSWHTVRIDGPDPTAILGTATKYAPYLEYGVDAMVKKKVRPYWVRSKSGKSLRKVMRERKPYHLKIAARKFARDTMKYGRESMLFAADKAMFPKKRVE